MPSSSPTAPRRTVLRYSVHGLTVRDELLLKSLIRVLDHRAHQHWECVAEGADLQVSGTPFSATATDMAGPAGHAGPAMVLRMGYPPGEGEFGLPMPLHAGHLEQMFNRIGELLVRQRAAAAAAVAQQPLRDDEPFRLRRWPPAALLQSAERRNLAALMSGRAQTAAALHRLSGVPLPLCLEFLRDLLRADLVLGGAAMGQSPSEAAPAAPAQATAPAPGLSMPSGLLGRIRARLGLQPAWSR